MNTVRFSIVLCTFNGAATLSRTFQYLALLDRPQQDIEFLVVDNASTDATPDLIPSEIAGHPVLKLSEPRPGKSFALNTGILNARGSFIVFIDDDVRITPGWLDGYDEAALAHPECNVFCGQIRPEYEVPAPDWLVHLCDLGKAFGTTAISLNSAIQPIRFFQAKGANLMFRASAIGPIHFDETEFNYSATATGGEDTFMVKQLTDGRAPPLFVPQATLYHWISSDEMSLDIIKKRYLRIGQTAERRKWLGAQKSSRTQRKALRKYQSDYNTASIKKAFAWLRRDQRDFAELSVLLSSLSGRIAYLKKNLSPVWQVKSRF